MNDTAAPEMGMEPLLREMVDRGASDLHITRGQPPMLRVDGALVATAGGRRLDAGRAGRLAASLLTQDQRRQFDDADELDFAFTVEGLARFRGNCFRQRGRVAMSVRHIPLGVASLKELGLPPTVNRMAERPRGLVLVTGPTGSGKSTTLAAMVDQINRRRRGHILTIEDPIEFVHPDRRCIVRPAGGGRGHAQLLRGAQACDAPGSGRHPHRRDAGHGDDGGRAGDRGDGPPCAVDAAHQLRGRIREPGDRLLRLAPAGPGAQPAGLGSGGGGDSDPRSRARRGGGGWWRRRCWCARPRFGP